MKWIVRSIEVALLIASVALVFTAPIMALVAFFFFILLYILDRCVLCKGDKCPKC